MAALKATALRRKKLLILNVSTNVVANEIVRKYTKGDPDSKTKRVKKTCDLQLTGETVGEVKAVADMHERKAEMARNLYR